MENISRVFIHLATATFLFTSMAAIAQTKEAAVPPNEDKADIKAVGPACYYNDSRNTWYVSVRWPSGNTNFVLPPGQGHRLNNMNDANTYECWSTQPIGSGCPNQRRTVVNNCG